MISSIDHVVILVENLDDGIAQYRGLGFTVTPGGKHPRFTHNALVSFADGSYLELIAFWETADQTQDAEMHRWQKHLSHRGGLIDYAVGVKPLDDDLTAIAERGIAVDGPHPGARSRLDGVQVAWKMGMPLDKQPGCLPFMIEDITDRSVRVPGGPATAHENGILGIDTLTIVTSDGGAAAGRYRAFLGTEGVSGTANPTFKIGSQRVELLQPGPTGPAADQLRERGDSLYELTFFGPREATYAPDQAGNARLRVIART